MNVHSPIDPLGDPLADTIARQQRASNPLHSAWVSANAGSGKTTVLAHRVVRLLLAGTEPARILCLTYTKAAAAEMSNRIFGMLAGWALLDDAGLGQAIERIQGFAPEPDRLARARTLFARSLETPGGLKIQTIHAFCEGILHQFPLEANVPSHFEVLQDERQAAMLADARAAMWVAAREDDALGLAAARAMEHATDTAIAGALGEAIARREHVQPWLKESGGPKGAEAALLARFGFAGDETAETLKAKFWADAPLGRNALDALCARALQSKSKTDLTFFEQMGDALRTGDRSLQFDACIEAMLKKDSVEPTSRGLTKKTVGEALADDYRDHAAAVGQTLARIRTLATIRRSTDLFTLADDVIHRYETAKRAGGFLDFDDLIARTADLLERSEAAAWVHYKLDRGLHHVLVDEAQDTSPRQWRIVGKLVEEFFAGEGAVEPDDVGTGVARTVFAVGDEKQSIFSFQGAAPEEFEAQRRRLRAMAEAVDEGEFEDVPLFLSFRSTQDVLTAVDIVFRHGDHGEGLTSREYQPHSSVRGAAPGCVDIWDLARPEKVDEPEDWTAPIDQVGGGHQAVIAANRIAGQIAEWLADGEVLEATGKPIRPADILVLVRARDQFVTALTRALKLADVPVAGADRLVLTDHIAVKDLVALGRTVLLPEDDLSLAEVLRSPLFDVSEDQLYELAQGREGSLDTALSASSEHALAAAKLATWRELAERVPVHDFYAKVLGPDGGRRDLYARLGREAEDVIDAFLQAALDHEATGPGGLQGFVAAMTASEQQIKREMDAARDEVRIMTVHGAKGLEAPVVFLVDKASSARGGGAMPQLYQVDDGGFLWVPSKGDHTPETQSLVERIEEAADAEYRRLLYVAMTRAADRLIVTGYRGVHDPKQPTWHDMVRAALEDECFEEDGFEGYTFRRFQLSRDEPWVPEKKEDEAKVATPDAARPDWLAGAVASEPDVPRPLTPSGAQALIENEGLRGTTPATLMPDEAETPRRIGEIARRRGTLVHRLLQTLPDVATDAREGTARRYLRSTLAEASEAQIEELVREVLAVMDAPATQGLLTGGRAEVAVMGRLDLSSGTRMVTGQIDRLHVADDVVTIIDYKTNRAVPRDVADVPGEYVTQLALYRHLVARLYPDRGVRAVLVWTHAEGGPAVMALPGDMLDAALAVLEAA